MYRIKQYIIYNSRGGKKRGLLLSPITNQASLKYADREQQFFHCHLMSSDQVASGTHHPSSKRSSDSASFVRLLKELIKLSVLCHSTGGCVILLATSGILVLFKVPYFSIPVCLLLCGKKQDTNTSLDRALKKRSWGTVPIFAVMITVESLTITLQSNTGLVSNQNTKEQKVNTRLEEAPTIH